VDYQFADVEGVKTRYVIKGTPGNAPPIFLVHGWGCSLETISGLIEKFSISNQVIALDLPGHGKSGLPTGTWGTVEYATFLGKFLDVLSIPRCNALGHSVGGRFLTMLAALEPNRINKLIIAGASGIKPKRKPKYYFKVALAKTGKFAAKYFGAYGKKFKDKVYGKIASPDYATAGELRSSFIKIINEDIRDKFPDVKAESLLLWGEADLESPISSSKIFEKLIPKSKLVILKNAGHYSFLDQPERFILEIKKFLRE